MLNNIRFKFLATAAAVACLSMPAWGSAQTPESAVSELMMAIARGDHEAISRLLDFSGVSSEEQAEFKHIFARVSRHLQKQCAEDKICLRRTEVTFAADPNDVKPGETLEANFDIYLKTEPSVNVRLIKVADGWKVIPE